VGGVIGFAGGARLFVANGGGGTTGGVVTFGGGTPGGTVGVVTSGGGTTGGSVGVVTFGGGTDGGTAGGVKSGGGVIGGSVGGAISDGGKTPGGFGATPGGDVGGMGEAGPNPSDGWLGGFRLEAGGGANGGDAVWPKLESVDHDKADAATAIARLCLIKLFFMCVSFNWYSLSSLTLRTRPQYTFVQGKARGNGAYYDAILAVDGIRDRSPMQGSSFLATQG
jgi:hypothetical protein